MKRLSQEYTIELNKMIGDSDQEIKHLRDENNRLSMRDMELSNRIDRLIVDNKNLEIKVSQQQLAYNICKEKHECEVALRLQFEGKLNQFMS